MGDLQPNQSGTAQVECDEFYRGMLKHVANGVYSVDMERRIMFWNKAAERLTGYSSAAVCGHRCSENILRHVTESGRCLCTEGCPLAATLHDGVAHEAHIFLHHHDGYRVPVQVAIRAQRGPDGEIIGAVETFSGNTVYMKTLDQMQQAEKKTFTDPLSGLANHRFMNNAFEARIAEMRRTGSSFGVILVEADHFKDFCNTHGNDVGQRMMKVIAQTLLLNICNSDVVGRWNDESFMVIAPHIDAVDFDRLARRLCALSANSWLNLDEDRQASMTVSIGAAMSNSDDDMARLLERTENLLARSKAAGGNCVTGEYEAA